FEPFFTTKAPGAGTGLGLSQVYGFARQSSGHVTIRSEPARGTTVNLYLPRSKGTKPVLLDEPNRSVLEGRGEKILVVEDDRGVREHLLEMLGDMSYSVLTADNAEAALKIIADPKQQIDLLLTMS
ncbi:MAG: ATP-binding protein, partial [Bradyrhizobium sp.]|uniref:ATP-binding protein n=1 Tax=Bradyrhizobium sp. TaxID=376 RepID=UPI003C7ABE8A